jgi:hypothetical protein
MIQDPTHPTHQKDQLQGLAIFLPVFVDPDFSFGAWQPATQGPNGIWSLPYFTFSKDAERFFRATYDLGWVDVSFDWMTWRETEDARRLSTEYGEIATATVQQLRQLLTMCVRMDRYCEGSLASDFASGLLTAIVCRAAALAQHAQDRGTEAKVNT